MYFNSTLTDSSKLLKPLLVFSFIIGAIVCGLTRIIQYKNHAVDVYLGFLLGGAIAIYLVRFPDFLVLCCLLPANKQTEGRGNLNPEAAFEIMLPWLTLHSALCCRLKTFIS